MEHTRTYGVKSDELSGRGAQPDLCNHDNQSGEKNPTRPLCWGVQKLVIAETRAVSWRIKLAPRRSNSSKSSSNRPRQSTDSSACDNSPSELLQQSLQLFYSVRFRGSASSCSSRIARSCKKHGLFKSGRPNAVAQSWSLEGSRAIQQWIARSIDNSSCCGSPKSVLGRTRLRHSTNWEVA